MLKVLIVGQQSERILEASRFFRDRDFEVYLMPYPILEELEWIKTQGINGVLICDEQKEMWEAWLKRNHSFYVVMH